MPWIFLLLPWIELWTLIELGSRTSALTALGYVLLTLVLGMTLIRRQGVSLLRQAQQQGGEFFSPRFLMDDLSLVSCGLLLVVPGLVTDLMAVIVLIGPLRRRVFGQRIQVYEAEVHRRSGPEEHTTLEGDYRRIDD